MARWLAGAEDDAESLGLDRCGAASRAAAPTPGWAAGCAGSGWSGRVPPSASARRTEAFFADVDVLLTPVTTGPPLAARPWHERGFLANVTADARWAPFASPWNLAGVPAAVVPAGTRPQGWPLAVQLVGPPGAERRLLWLAGELERRRPWRRHAPVFDPLPSPAAAAV